MPYSGAALAYSVAGGLILYSGVKGASISNTVKGALTGNLGNVKTLPPLPGNSNPATGDTGAANSTAAQNQALAKQIADSMGLSSWTTGQAWQDWVSLWNQESGWSATAENPTSGAYGIPQALPPTKMPAAAQASGGSDPAAQIEWGISYIQGRYGSPVMAWAHEQANNWY